MAIVPVLFSVPVVATLPPHTHSSLLPEPLTAAPPLPFVPCMPLAFTVYVIELVVDGLSKY